MSLFCLVCTGDVLQKGRRQGYDPVYCNTVCLCVCECVYQCVSVCVCVCMCVCTCMPCSPSPVQRERTPTGQRGV